MTLSDERLRRCGLTLRCAPVSDGFARAVCGQHGFVSVTRMTGEGAVLLVVPENGTAR